MTSAARYFHMERHLQPQQQAGCGKSLTPTSPGRRRRRSLLNPCASFESRAAKVQHNLSFVSLPLLSPSKPFDHPTIPETSIPLCLAIDTVQFYKAFNRLLLRSYQHRARHQQDQRNPFLFDRTGKVLQVKVNKNELKMPSSCKDIRAALAACLQSSDCIMIQRHTPADCLRPPLLETMPTKCQQLKKGYGECKRGMVDMRKRFRGNQPIAVSKELEGGAREPNHQLYAGKPAFAGTVKITEGREPEERDWRELENERLRKES